MSLYNGDGALSSSNVTGPYYGQFGRNTQLRVSVPEGMSYLRLSYDRVSYAECPAPSTSISGAIDVRIDMAMDDWHDGEYIAGVWDQTGNQRSWQVFMQQGGYPTFLWSTDGTQAGELQLICDAPVMPPPSPQRMCLRVTFDPSTGTATFYTAPAGLTGATWTQLGSPQVAGATTLYGASAAVQIGYLPGDEYTDWYALYYTQAYTSYPAYWGFGATGKFYALEVLDGINGTAVANPDFTAQAAGATSFTDAAGNTWTFEGTAAIDDRRYRFHGEVAAWPQSWGPVGNDVNVTIQAGGLLRRVGMGSTPTNSAMYRAAVRQTGTLAPVAYWPMEDGANATQIASALPGGTPMQIAGTPTMSSNSDFPGSASIPVLNGAIFSGDIAPYTAGTANAVTFLMEVPAAGEANGAVIASLFTQGGSVSQMDLIYGTGGTLQLIGYQSSSGSKTAVFTSATYSFAVNGQMMLISFQLTPTDWAFQGFVIGKPGAVASATGTYTLGTMTRLVFNPGRTLVSTAIGHAIVQTAPITLGTWYGPANAWAGEFAGMRFMRLCTEEGIPFIGRGNLSNTVQVGVQSPQTISQLLQECVDADQSIWMEPRQVAGFGFRTRESVANQVPAVVFDYNKDQLSGALSPTQDDQTTINDVTVSQEYDGSSARAVKTTGALSIAAPPDGVGRYDTEVTVNLQDDSGLMSVATWMMNKSTVDEPRYPGIEGDLANTALPAPLYYAIQDMDLGDRLQVINPPPWLPPWKIDQIIQQCSETIFIKTFQQKWVGVPATPWNVAVIEDPAYGHVDTAGSELESSYSAALNTNPFFVQPASPMSGPTPAGVASLAGWTAVNGTLALDQGVTYPGGPFQNSAVYTFNGSVLNSNPVFEVDGTGSLAGWSGYLGTLSLDNSQTYPGGQYPWSCVYSGEAEGSIAGAAFTAAAGSEYQVYAYVYSPTAGTINIGLNWYDGSTYLSQSLTAVTVTADTWTQISSAALTAPSSCNSAAINLESAGTTLVAQNVFAQPNGAGTYSEVNGSPAPFACTPGTAYATSAWVYLTTAATVKIGFDFLSAPNAYLSTSTTSVTVPAGTWTAIGSASITAPSGAAYAYPRIGESSPLYGAMAVQGFSAWQGGQLSIATTAGPLWTTSASYLPFDIIIAPIGGMAGEVMTVTGISGSSSPQAFTVARGKNGVFANTTNISNADVRLYPSPFLSLP